MMYNLKCTGITPSLENTNYLEKKIHHLDKILPPDTSHPLEVVFVHTAIQEREKYTATLHLSVQKKSIYAQAQGSTLHEAIDLVVAEFETEAVRIKEKERTTVRTQAARVKDFFKGFRNKP